ncbi:transcriptional regulator [Sporolactobacillus sp. THM7-7]|nr:transcriptional regulator [Sporolactobacillus sp. THM7-7]
MAARAQHTKDKILDILKRKQKLSVRDLSDLLHMTEMGVRKHLIPLGKKGFIQAENVRKSVGRPVQYFSLTEKAERLFPKNYEGMTVHFLMDMKNLYGQESVERLFARRKDRLFKEYRSAIPDDCGYKDRTAALEKLQNDRGYMSQLRQIDETTYELIEYNCPIFAVANRFKTACRHETDLIAEVLGASSVSRTMCRADGDTYCRFIIHFGEIKNAATNR